MTETKGTIKPRTKVTSEIRAEDKGILDLLNTEQVPDELVITTASYFRDRDAEAENRIAAVRTDAHILKQSYAIGIREAYATLMRMIKRCQENEVNMICDITGREDTIGDEPDSEHSTAEDEPSPKSFTIEDWGCFHPGELVAIRYVLRQLRLNNWQPTVRPSTPEFANHPCLQVICEFRE
jgi:hypothetical protein